MPVKEKGGCSVGKKADKGGCKEGKKKKLVVVKKGKMVEKKLYKGTLVTEAPAKKKVVATKPKLDLEEVGIMGGKYYRDIKTGKYYIDQKGTETSNPKDPTRGGKFHVFVNKTPFEVKREAEAAKKK